MEIHIKQELMFIVAQLSDSLNCRFAYCLRYKFYNGRLEIASAWEETTWALGDALELLFCKPVSSVKVSED